MQAGPNINQERMPGWRDPRNFIVVSDPYPTVSAIAADLILPTAMWVEKEGLTECGAPDTILASASESAGRSEIRLMANGAICPSL